MKSAERVDQFSRNQGKGSGVGRFSRTFVATMLPSEFIKGTQFHIQDIRAR